MALTVLLIFLFVMAGGLVWSGKLIDRLRMNRMRSMDRREWNDQIDRQWHNVGDRQATRIASVDTTMKAVIQDNQHFRSNNEYKTISKD